ncbi:MAG: carboxylesterase/lipase family protein, partial [Myxococcaceae bacterium]
GFFGQVSARRLCQLARPMTLLFKRLGLWFIPAVLVACGTGANKDTTPLPGDESVQSDPGQKIESSDVAREYEACPVAANTDPLTVATTDGLVKGEKNGDVLTFLGIPYAKPPLGDRRFEISTRHACWSGVRDTTGYGPSCVQPDLITGAPTGSEDCLSLNVWTPATTPKRPVLVFIHGGGEIVGGTNQTLFVGNLYNGEKLAKKQDAVVVSFNYRLGPLGFLAHPALKGGNYGLYDALLALRWVQANAARFGGDPSKVMLFGESAGAFNVCALVASPLGKGLFSSALMQSGNCDAPSLDQRYPSALAVAKKLNCEGVKDVKACLQSATIEDIVAAGGSLMDATPGSATINPKTLGHLPYGAVVDGTLLTKTPLEALRDGTHNHVPFVIGTNEDEYATFSIVPGAVPTTCLEYESRVHSNFGALADKVIDLYSCNWLNPIAGRDAYIRLISDALMTCPSRRALQAVSKSQTQPAYRYLYTHRYGYGPLFALGAFHAGELPFVFGTFTALGYVPLPSERDLSETIQTRWVALARTGAPTGATQLDWPRYNPAVDNALTLDTTESVINHFEKAGCDFWDSVQ